MEFFTKNGKKFLMDFIKSGFSCGGGGGSSKMAEKFPFGNLVDPNLFWVVIRFENLIYFTSNGFAWQPCFRFWTCED